MTVKLMIEIEETEVIRLSRRAVVRGFLREEPRKAWTEKEYRQSLRFLIGKLLKGEQ